MPVKPATQNQHSSNSPTSKVLTIGDAVYDLDDHTPMMVQYLTMKVNYPQALLLYRMGDFYELFFDDAKRAAQILDITLTRRGTDKAGNTIAMAGVPFHAADSYMARLIAAGQTVVVCEQIDESTTSQLPTMGAKSKKDTADNINTSSKGGKAKAATIMRREVVKTLTAGTITDDALISEGSTPTVVAIDIAAMKKGVSKDANKNASKEQPLQAAISQLDLAAGTLTTQELSATSSDELQIQMLTVLARFAPSECIVSEALNDTIGEDWLLWLRSTLDCPIIEVAANDFHKDHAPNTLCQQFDVQRLDGLGILDMPLSQTSCAALIHYARQTQQRHVPQVNQLIVEHDDDYLIIDANSQQNLELFAPVSSNGTSLISVVNHCKTPMGRRLLVQQMKRPLRQHSLIDQRLDAIGSLLNNERQSNDHQPNTSVTELRQTLNAISDVERISSRIGLMSARPRDLRKLCDSIASSAQLGEQLNTLFMGTSKGFEQKSSEQKGLLPLLMQYLPAQMPAIKEIAELIGRSIVIEPPAHIRDGGMIASGFDEEFDRLSHLHDNIQATLDEMLERERQAHQLSSLKVGFNKVSGFYFELPKMQAQNAPEHFIRRQTLKSSERFITDELKTVETEYLSAQTLALAREKQLYQQLLITLSGQLGQLQQLSAAIAQIDVLSNWAQLAITYNWQRPIMGNEIASDDLVNSKNADSPNLNNAGSDNLNSNNERQQTQLNFDEPSLANNQAPNSISRSSQNSPTSIDIKAGRHLVVEAALNPSFVTSKANKNSTAKQTRAFVANDCQLGTGASNLDNYSFDNNSLNNNSLDKNSHPERLLLITGPNMGGKSTYMRQTALIVLLAHCGSYVPAASARIGDIDRIFTRIGSADDLAGGKSTFMVEMIETANILNQATNKSLVLMDEVGRGTATTDGLAIAHACVNKLLEIGCLTLFATHYFELTQLADRGFYSCDNTDGNNNISPYKNGNKPTGIRNVHVAASDVDGQLLLLHQIREGAASSSFGLHVAKMAGIPHEVLEDAESYLVDNLNIDNVAITNVAANNATATQALDDTINRKSDLTNSINEKRQLNYPNSSQNHADTIAKQATTRAEKTKQDQLLDLQQALDSINPDSLTPKQAHDMLYTLKHLISC